MSNSNMQGYGDRVMVQHLHYSLNATYSKLQSLTHSDGSSLLKTGDRAATIRGDRNVRTRASDKGRYCRHPYRLATAPNPKQPLRTSSHFLQNCATLSLDFGLGFLNKLLLCLFWDTTQQTKEQQKMMKNEDCKCRQDQVWLTSNMVSDC